MRQETGASDVISCADKLVGLEVASIHFEVLCCKITTILLQICRNRHSQMFLFLKKAIHLRMTVAQAANTRQTRTLLQMYSHTTMSLLHLQVINTTRIQKQKMTTKFHIIYSRGGKERSIQLILGKCACINSFFFIFKKLRLAMYQHVRTTADDSWVTFNLVTVIYQQFCGVTSFYSK